MIEKLPTVLIVDDDESIRDTLEAILKKDYSVITVEDGETALRVAESEEVNVILLDIMLPGMGGL
ncbi:MAG: response regulator, partial [Syntrophobacterales bacterium]